MSTAIKAVEAKIKLTSDLVINCINDNKELRTDWDGISERGKYELLDKTLLGIIDGYLSDIVEYQERIKILNTVERLTK